MDRNVSCPIFGLFFLKMANFKQIDLPWRKASVSSFFDLLKVGNPPMIRKQNTSKPKACYSSSIDPNERPYRSPSVSPWVKKNDEIRMTFCPFGRLPLHSGSFRSRPLIKNYAKAYLGAYFSSQLSKIVGQLVLVRLCPDGLNAILH